MNYRDTLKVTTAFVLAAAITGGASKVAYATPNTGSATIGSGGAVPGGVITLQSTFTYSPTLQFLSSPSGGYSTVIPGSDPLTTLGSFNFSGGAITNQITFTDTAGNTFTQSPSTPDFYTLDTASTITVDIFGTFQSAGLTPTIQAAAVIVTFSQVGGPGSSISYGGTITSTIPAVPEPVSMSILGVGLAGLGMARRRKAAKSA